MLDSREPPHHPLLLPFSEALTLVYYGAFPVSNFRYGPRTLLNLRGTVRRLELSQGLPRRPARRHAASSLEQCLPRGVNRKTGPIPPAARYGLRGETSAPDCESQQMAAVP